MSHSVVLVNEEDHTLGTAEKLRAHIEGWLHRAFSVFIFNPQGRLLVQRRNADKYHSGGLWSNTCCSHPRPGESPLNAARRRLPEEMGFKAPLEAAFQRTYHLSVGERLVEHEHNHVFVGTVHDPQVQPNAEEVSEWRWVAPSVLRDDIGTRPQQYTAWFRLLLDPVLSDTPTGTGISSIPSTSPTGREPPSP